MKDNKMLKILVLLIIIVVIIAVILIGRIIDKKMNPIKYIPEDEYAGDEYPDNVISNY